MNRSDGSKYVFDQGGAARSALQFNCQCRFGILCFGLEKWFHAEFVVLRGKARLMREFVAFDATFP